uniref:Uncharacterized protein n=1 Tax=Glossina palpalis gambiensis TaxID=67801 RepID=A0A1B0BNE2_9MUSC
LISNILVGSSNNKRSGLENKARAKAKRIRQPPENDFVGLCCIAVSNPSPFNITEARATALSASMFCIIWRGARNKHVYTSQTRIDCEDIRDAVSKIFSEFTAFKKKKKIAEERAVEEPNTKYQVPSSNSEFSISEYEFCVSGKEISRNAVNEDENNNCSSPGCDLVPKEKRITPITDTSPNVTDPQSTSNIVKSIDIFKLYLTDELETSFVFEILKYVDRTIKG